MQVHEAVASRLSARAFLPDPVSGETIRRVLERAARAPSGGNLQPWHIDVLAGEALAAFKALMQARLTSTGPPEPAEYDIYPKVLRPPWRDRRFAVGEAMYARLGIAREDKAARRRWFANNFAFFGAPLALFCSVDREMGPPQWSDLGMYLQTVMLLLREEGLDSCAQECWAIYPDTVRDTLQLHPSACCSAAWRSAGATPRIRSTRWCPSARHSTNSRAFWVCEAEFACPKDGAPSGVRHFSPKRKRNVGYFRAFHAMID